MALASDERKEKLLKAGYKRIQRVSAWIRYAMILRLHLLLHCLVMFVSSEGLTPLPNQLKYFVKSTKSTISPRVHGVPSASKYSISHKIKETEDRIEAFPKNTVAAVLNKKELEAMLLDPELKYLKNKIHDGIEAQRELRDRLKRLNLQSRNRAIKTEAKNGDSWKKPLLKQLGVRITKQRKLLKRRSEGRLKSLKIFKPHKFVKSGRAETSNVFNKRFYADKTEKQVQVAPSKVVAELTLHKALNKVFSPGKIVTVDDFDDIIVKEKKRHESPKYNTTLKKIDHENRPAFCRRCYKFFSTITDTDIAKVYQYCCTVGNHKSRLFESAKSRTL
ncbi:unnamed protein product [Bursaphelenchus okinawaensis]|uniref:Uncharacterized protein n=1 Tax=Bursaphelenchus okinawaensis TaxID=465554 RepID=A0A811LPG8_9BILA|nr:unnamed protein product [Bursaphelenchus okinawaensis]CAG9126960.1 unnamed protein product [Bursaphelenchus okinawaensis]